MISAERFNEPWHAEFISNVIKTTSPGKDCGLIVEAIFHILSGWEDHAANEHIWAHPDNGLVARFCWPSTTFTTRQIRFAAAVDLVRYLEGLVVVTMMGDTLVGERIFGGGTMTAAQLGIPSLVQHSTNRWVEAMHQLNQQPAPRPTAAAAASGRQAPPQQQQQQKLLLQQQMNTAAAIVYSRTGARGASDMFTPRELVASPDAVRLFRVRDLLLERGILEQMAALDARCDLATTAHGLVERLLWYLATVIVQQPEDERCMLSRAWAVTGAAVEDAWRTAIQRIRGFGFRYAYEGEQPGYLRGLNEHIEQLLGVIQELELRGRWVDSGGLLADLFRNNVGPRLQVKPSRLPYAGPPPRSW
ncbi:hypothetical protein SPI_01401 [Niveomyces insectorum RCEF 264]|uniref:Uncharacterized protein n=1 Tax=Niveomyces insectorum RCEF 264 TaxID=1081102 RepID=A0A167YXS7_9HYPO|nr:hypothetical protein SPI_01401 [Niveomyces insectorum RCEF 264]